MLGVTRWRGLMPWTVIVETCSTTDSYGARSYQSCAAYPAAIQGPTRFLHRASQQERVSTQTLYIGSVAPITTQDRITLPAAFESAQPPLIEVRRVSDRTGLHHTVIHCG